MARFYLRRSATREFSPGERVKGTGKQSDLVDAINGKLIATTCFWSLPWGIAQNPCSTMRPQ